MSEFKGTPGPWEIKPEEVDKHYIRIRGTRLGRRFKVANVLTPFYEGVLARDAQETRANAHLIAAAPELLEALMDISRGCVDMGKVNAAVAKALGEGK